MPHQWFHPVRSALATAGLFLAAVPLASASPLVSTRADQQEISLTIYNDNLGLVKDRRSLAIPGGTSELRFMDVASQIIPASVRIGSLNDSNGLQVLEQNYEYDLLNPQKLLDKYVGKEVKLYQKNPYTEREEEVTATLLSNNGSPVFRIGKDITFGHPGRLIFPGVPDDLIAKPTLVWLLESHQGTPQQIEASYLTNGITWRADYVLTIDRDNRLSDVTGWVTIDNKSGATYRNAHLKLVAGAVNRVLEEQPRGMVYKSGMLTGASAPQFREESFFEYHLYTLQRPSTIKENQIKQISLLSANGVPIRKELVLRGEQAYFYAPQGSAEETRQKVGVYIEFENSRDHQLGIPLPKGTVRVYQSDADGNLQFVGEDAIGHIPRDERVRVKLGEAFDVTATRRQTDWKKLASDTYEAAWEIVIRNHKKEDVTIKVVEPMSGDWQVVDASREHRRADSRSVEFKVPVKSAGETKLTYRVRTRY